MKLLVLPVLFFLFSVNAFANPAVIQKLKGKSSCESFDFNDFDFDDGNLQDGDPIPDYPFIFFSQFRLSVAKDGSVKGSFILDDNCDVSDQPGICDKPVSFKTKLKNYKLKKITGTADLNVKLTDSVTLRLKLKGIGVGKSTYRTVTGTAIYDSKGLKASDTLSCIEEF